ncbi:MAG: hypothetical protein AMJ53_17630 [Gammaproteobacteria bacterium SG8_11]|nr:MAG: hypothetical protein AMJ53_17630 [Gammaproteobacteria bacterium SG8_11]
MSCVDIFDIFITLLNITLHYRTIPYVFGKPIAANLMTEMTKNDSRGRPPNGPLDALKAKTWFWKVASKIGVTTGYGMEKYFSPGKVVKVTGGGTNRSGKYDKIKKGLHVPNDETIELAAKEIPESKKLINHPLWVVAKQPVANAEEFYIQLRKLRPEISNQLFLDHLKQGEMPVRFQAGISYPIDDISKESDLDAFTACVGLLQESIYFSSLTALYRHHFAKQTLFVLLRFISQPPFYRLAQDYFDYFRKYFFEAHLKEEWVQKLDLIHLPSYITYYQTIEMLIEDYQILRHHLFVPSTCLYLAEKYITPEVFENIEKLLLEGKPTEITKLKEFRNLVRCLRRWEEKQLKKRRH